MKISLCQMDIIWENKEVNRKQAEEYCKEASLQNADLLLFPEMSLTGFSMNIEKTKEDKEETITVFKEIAIQYHIAVGIGWVKVHGKDKAENHYTIISKEGEILSDYTKIHPFRFAKETDYFVSGEGLSFCKLNDFTIATLICYDLRFPEIFQAASKTADLIIVPANWPERRREHFRCLLKARAIENQVYICGINCFGEKGGLYYTGDSCVINPLGDVLQELTDRAGLITVVLENDVADYQKQFPMKMDRKTNLYKELL